MIAIIDYGMGNLRSVQKAFEAVGHTAEITSDPDAIRRVGKVILPGVGAFGRCMESLRESGLDTVAVDAIRAGKPFLGICIGMQMLYEGSEEDPEVAGLGILTGAVRRLPEGVKHPQMQWNVLQPLKPKSPLLAGLDARQDDALRAKRQGLENIGAAPERTIHEDGHLAGDSVDDIRQCQDGCLLARTHEPVRRHDNAVGAVLERQPCRVGCGNTLDEHRHSHAALED